MNWGSTVCGLAVAGDFHDGRVVQQRAQVLLDGMVDRGREEQRLAIGGGGVYDGGDGGQEAHVKHAVRFVQHEGLDAAEVDDAFVHEVVQAAGRGDEHVGAASDLVDLGAVGRTAEHGGHVVPRLAGDLHACLRDLLRQLTGGADHQHAGRALAPLAARQGAQDGQQERGGLTRAGAGGCDEVAAFQDQRGWPAAAQGWGSRSPGVRRRQGQPRTSRGRRNSALFVSVSLRARSMRAFRSHPLLRRAIALDSSRFLIRWHCAKRNRKEFRVKRLTIMPAVGEESKGKCKN